MPGDLPENIFLDDVYTSRGGESMPVFLERLREGPLRGFSWLFSGEVMDILKVKPSNGMTREVVLRYARGIVTVKLHRHGGWRKKLFDSDMSIPLAPQGVSSGVITVGWLDDGRMMVRSDARKGSHGMHYMKQRWFGYSILVRVSECQSEANMSSC